MKTGPELIAEERARQVAKEGWSPQHDDDHDNGSLAKAAACYALCAVEQALGWDGPFTANPQLWPWQADEFKPKDQLRNLVRAGALIAAEIDRLQRHAARVERGTEPYRADCPKCRGTGRTCCNEPIFEDRSMPGHPMSREQVCCGELTECDCDVADVESGERIPDPLEDVYSGAHGGDI